VYRKGVINVRISRVRFNDYARTIHTQYRATDEDGFNIGWSEAEKIETEKEWFERKLKGK